MTLRYRILMNAFLQFMNQIRKDAMLIMLSIAPILSGLFFRYGIPFIQTLLTRYLNLPELLLPYNLLFDLLLGSLSPVLYCFAAAYVILGEIDDGLSKYLAVTPVGKRGYLISRLVFPAFLAFIISIVIMSIFKLSNISLIDIILVSFTSSLLGIVEALLVVSLSSNKVEGMAVSKLSGLFFLGLPVPFFISGNIAYLLFFVPSFWLAKYAINKDFLSMFLCIVVSIGWIFILQKKFTKKIR